MRASDERIRAVLMTRIDPSVAGRIPRARLRGEIAQLVSEIATEDRAQLNKFEEATLRQIAANTGGRYLRSTTGGELATSIDDIVKGERKVQGWRTTTEYQDLYPLALALAAAAGAALWLLL